MDDRLIRTCHLLKEINNAIEYASTLEEGLRECVKLLKQDMGVSYATYWQATTQETLLPLFWYGPYDIATRSHKPGSGIVGRSFESQEAVRLQAGDAQPDDVTAGDFPNIELADVLCAPVSSSFVNYGILQVANKDDGSSFTEDETNVVEMAALLCALVLGRNEPLPDEWSFSAPLLQATDITREYTNGDVVTKVLKGATFNVYENELVVLLGESGCGKSTLLNIIAGLDDPTEGTVAFCGENRTSTSEHDLIRFRRDNIGMIFQSYNLIPVLSARQNLNLIGELVPDPIDRKEALELVGLGDKLESLPHQLSGGQQQRVAIARALIKRPRIILADEPTAALDYDTSIEILQALKNAMDTGCTIVMVTHNEELCRMANRIVRMRDGKISQVQVNLSPAQPKELVW